MNAPRRAVAVIHGIGDQRQGDTVERLAASYFADDTVEFEKSRLGLPDHVDTDAHAGKIKSFSAELLKVDKGPGLLFAEVYWADISRIWPGFFGLLVGIWQILTGLRFVISRAADPRHAQEIAKVSRLVGWLGGAINWMLVGPLVALNALMLILATVYFGEAKGYAEELTILVVTFIIVAAMFSASSTEYMAKSTLIVSLSIFLAFAMIIVVIGQPSYADNNIETYAALLLWFSGLFWFMLAALMWALLAITGIAFLYLFVIRRQYPSLMMACAGPCLNVGLWCFVLSLLWMLALYLASLSIGGFDIVESTRKTLPFLGFTWLFFLFLVGSLLSVFVLRRKTVTRGNITPPDWLRLILSPIAILVILTFAALWIVAIANYIFPTQFWFLSWIDHVIDFFNMKIISAIAFIVGLISLSLNRIGQALDLLLDVVTYFRREKSDAVVHLPQAPGQTTQEWMPSFRTKFVKREKIADRFKSLIHHLVHHEGIQDITVVAHSQGTVTAIRQLETIGQWLGAPLPKINLVTMGSPYGHIYQYYFPGDFGTPAPEVNQWLNIYAIDDYVGTVIRGHGPTMPVNLDVKAIGHNGYWTDRQVMEIIRTQSPF